MLDKEMKEVGLLDSTIMTLSSGIQFFKSKVIFIVSHWNKCQYWTQHGYKININSAFWVLGQAVKLLACKENPLFIF